MKKYISIILTGLLLFSCKIPNEEHEHDGHEEKIVSHTFLAKDYEIFVKHPVLVAGKRNVFTTFITKLENYKPLDKGIFTVSLIKESKGIRQRIDNPKLPGIFRPALTPKESGKYSIVFNLEIEDTSIQFIIDSIHVFSGLVEASQFSENNDNGNEITFLKEQAWKANFNVEKTKSEDFKEVISTSGQILPANGDEKTMVAPFSGIVRLPDMLLAGKKVQKGQILMTLSGKGLARDNIAVHFAEIKSNYERAKSNYDRLKKLVSDKIVSEKNFIDARTEYEQAKTAYDNVSGGGNVSLIKSGISGYVKDVKVSEGQFVEAGTPLAIIAQNKKLVIKADVSQNHWHCLPNISEANFITPHDSKLYNTIELNGRLISYSRNATTSAWSTPVFFEIRNQGDLISGSYIEVFLLSKPIPNIIAIPISALIEEQEHYYVFVQLAGDQYEKRHVEIGISNGKEVEVTSGLNVGELIVTEGAYQIKLASMSSSLPAHGHVH